MLASLAPATPNAAGLKTVTRWPLPLPTPPMLFDEPREPTSCNITQAKCFLEGGERFFKINRSEGMSEEEYTQIVIDELLRRKAALHGQGNGTCDANDGIDTDHDTMYLARSSAHQTLAPIRPDSAHDLSAPLLPVSQHQEMARHHLWDDRVRKELRQARGRTAQ